MSKRSTKSYAIGDKFGDVDGQSVAQSFFGAGYVAETRADADEGEKALSVNMRLLTKASVTTKQKALSEMVKAIPAAADEILAGFLYNYIDAVGKHLFHENPQLRCAVFKTLTAFLVSAGKETKRQVVQNLGPFMSYVLFGMHDPDPQAAKAATEALHACFTDADKRAVALNRSFAEVSAFVTSNLESSFSTCSAIKNDDEETEAFCIIMGFGTVGYLLAHHPTPSETQPFALALFKGGQQAGYLRRCLPTDPLKPSKMVASAPKVRAAAFSLLTSLIAVTAPIPPRDFGFVWVCCMQGITDPQPAVVFTAWQMTLKWIERFRKEAVESMPDGFVGLALTQIDNLAVHNSGSGFEALLSALLPLVAVISREERHADVVDDVCGTLVEKVKSFCARPNSREFQLVWTTLWECWDLHLLRKSARNDAAHSLELLAVVLAVLVEQTATAAPTNAARLWDAVEGTVAPLAAKYLLKAVQRPETLPNASEALMTVLDSASQFKVISHAKDLIVLLRFAAVVGEQWLSNPSFVTKPAELRPILAQWFEDLFAKLLAVCEATAPVDGESVDELAEKKGYAYGSIAGLVKAISAAPVGGDDGVLFALSDSLQNRIVTATGAWSAFPSKLAPYLFKAERRNAASHHVDPTAATGDAEGPSPTSPTSPQSPTGGVQTSRTARALLDRITSAPSLDDATEADIKVLIVAIDSDNVAAAELLALFGRIAPHRRFVDAAAAILKALARCPPEGGLAAHAGSLCTTIRDAITAVGELTQSCASAAGARNASLAYDNEAPSASDSDSSSSDSSDSSSDDSDSSDSDDSSSDDGSDSSSNGSDASGDAKDGNLAEAVREGLVEWMDIVSDESFTKAILPCDAAERRVLTAPIAKTLFMGITGISPLLHVEQFVSLRFLRSAMSRAEAAVASQTFLHAVFTKKHCVSSDAFDSLLALYSNTCEDELLLEEADLKQIVTDFFGQYIYNKGAWEDKQSGTSHLEDILHVVSSPLELVSGKQLLDLAKPHLLVGGAVRRPNVDPTAEVIGLHQMATTLESLAGVLRLGQIAVAVAKDVTARKALLHAKPVDAGRVAALLVSLTAVMSLRMALSDGVVKACREAIQDVLMTLPFQGSFASVDDEAAAQQVYRSMMPGLAQHGLLPCFADVVGELFASVGAKAYSRKSVVTAAAEWYITLSMKEQQVLYAEAFQSFLDRAGVVNADRDRSIALSPSMESAIRTAFKAPATAFPICVSYLMIFRGAQSVLMVTDDEVMAMGIRCQKPEDEVKALALVSELLCANNHNPSLYTELCRMATQTATKNYTLAQLPSNGKLLQRPPTVVPPALESIQPTIMALAKAFKGMTMHRKRDDVLRSTINLVVFDAVCDAVSRLRAATTAALAPPTATTASAAAFTAANMVNSRNTSLAVLVHFVSKAYRHIATLQAGDIASIAASESAVAVISTTLASVHMWVCASTVAQLEAIGLSNVLEVVSCVNNLAIVALNQSPAPITNMIHLTRRKLLVKGTRILHVEGAEETGKLTTATVVKMPFFKKLFTDIERTTKQKVSLLTWLTSWACTLSNKRFSLEEGSGVDRSELVQLFDIAMALLLCPYTAHNGKGRVDNTFLYIGADQLSPEDNGFGFRPQVLGKLQRAASMHTAKRMGQELMGVLARAAACVLTLAVQSAALPAVRDWLESIDSSVRSRLLSFAEEHLCPILIQTSLVGVLSHSPTGEMSFEVEDGYMVKIDMERRYIGLTFTFEDVTSSLDINLPRTYPIAVSADMVKPTMQGSGKQAVQLRTWCMKMSMALFSGESQSLWDAVEMFGKNMKGYLEGVEPCPICYCVMSSKRTIPDMGCSVCRNKCHKVCLNKWWASTGNCTCPYCRSPWVV